ncbi:MAG TPA: Uma2 family endonuclease [Ktedonobacterales bacterium]|jgi:Uma2 family endonuclease
MGRYTITIEPGALTSAEEYARLPDEPGWHTELTDGRVIRMPMVKDHAHGWIIDNLSRRLSPYVHDRELGRLTYSQEGYDISNPGAEGETAWAPDLAFVATERVSIVREARRLGIYPRLAPDLAVEVISPSQTRKEATDKAQRWLAAGVRLMWVIWPESQTVEVWQADEPMRTLSAHDRLDGLEVVPGFTMPVAELFAF